MNERRGLMKNCHLDKQTKHIQSKANVFALETFG